MNAKSFDLKKASDPVRACGCLDLVGALAIPPPPMKTTTKKGAKVRPKAPKESPTKKNEERQLCLQLEHVTPKKATLLIPTDSDFTISLKKAPNGTRVTFSHFRPKQKQAQFDFAGAQYDVLRGENVRATQRHLNLHIVMRNAFSSQPAADGCGISSAAA